MTVYELFENIHRFCAWYEIDASSCVIVMGAALVLHGVRDTTPDIDIQVNADTYRRVSDKRPEGSRSYTVATGVEITSIPFHDTVVKMGYGGPVVLGGDVCVLGMLRIQPIPSILLTKIAMARRKDVSDIARIREFVPRDLSTTPWLG